jgi:tetratricopeptide (TPR) repeat protein
VKDILCTVQKYDLARRIPDLVKNPLSSSMMRHQIELAAGKHAAAAMCLEEYLGHKPPPDAAKNAKMTLAQIYRDNLGKYDKAIAIFQELNDPPRTLWELYSTYWSAGRKKEAYSMLVELESMFPSEAPRAFYTHAQRLEGDGNVKQAIAIYRRLLSQPEWKKTAESSWAHQALERHGVATGGAVVNEVR